MFDVSRRFPPVLDVLRTVCGLTQLTPIVEDGTGGAMTDATTPGADSRGEPPGWYPDPWERADERWWNGYEWSDRTRDTATEPESPSESAIEREEADHLPGRRHAPDDTPAVIEEDPDRPGWYPDPRGEADERWWDGERWTERTETGGVFSKPASEPASWRPYQIIGAVVVGLVIIGFGFGGGGDSSSPGRSGAEDYSPEEQLAMLVDDSVSEEAVRPYRLALNAAEPVCMQSRRSIADIAWRASQVAEDRGIDVTPLDLIRAMPEAVPPSERPIDCQEVTSTLIVLLTP